MGSYRRSVPFDCFVVNVSSRHEQRQINMRRHRYHDHTFTRRRKNARRYARSFRDCPKSGVHTIGDLPFLGIVPKLLSALRSAGIVTEDLSLSSDARDNLECTYRGLCVRPMKAGQEEDTQLRRIRRRIGARPTRYHSCYGGPG